MNKLSKGFFNLKISPISSTLAMPGHSILTSISDRILSMSPMIKIMLLGFVKRGGLFGEVFNQMDWPFDYKLTILTLPSSLSIWGNVDTTPTAICINLGKEYLKMVTSISEALTKAYSKGMGSCMMRQPKNGPTVYTKMVNWCKWFPLP